MKLQFLRSQLAVLMTLLAATACESETSPSNDPSSNGSSGAPNDQGGGGGGGGGSSDGGTGTNGLDGSSVPPQGDAALPPFGTPRTSARLFFSGHSLLDNPLADDVAEIAKSKTTPLWWNQQNLPGSLIRVRTRGNDPNSTSFPGYRTGKNRDGANMDIVAELRSPRTIDGKPYDALVLTERHDLPGTLQWEDTVRYARHFHERLIAGNPQATTFIYHAWWEMKDKNNPTAWITLERAASPAWSCVASRINTSLAAEGRSDRLRPLPAGFALTHLVERAIQGAGVPGITAANPRATIDALFDDNVHLTSLGVYFISLVTYASVYQQSPAGAWAPMGVSATAARSLQDLAWEIVSKFYASYTDPTMAQCSATMKDSFCGAFFSYATGEPNHINGCVNHFTGSSNPFSYNAGSDRTYWFPAP